MEETIRLKDKVAIITGSGSGIGKASAKLFAKEGAKIVVADINPDAGQEVAEQIRAEGKEATFIEVDVSRPADAKRMVQTSMESYGRIDILFNNAGTAGATFETPVPGKSFEEAEEENWRQVIEVNHARLTGLFNEMLGLSPIRIRLRANYRLP